MDTQTYWDLLENLPPTVSVPLRVYLQKMLHSKMNVGYYFKKLPTLSPPNDSKQELTVPRVRPQD